MLMNHVTSGEMTFAEQKFGQEKWCKGEFEVGWNDVNDIKRLFFFIINNFDKHFTSF